MMDLGQLTEHESRAWDAYFCSVAAMQFHPGNTHGTGESLPIEQCAEIADRMLIERRKRQCLGS